MPWNYYQYLAANFGISFGLAFLSLIIMIALLLCRTSTFYLFVKLFFNIEHSERYRKAEHTKKGAHEQEGWCCHYQPPDEPNTLSCWCCWCCPCGRCFCCRSQPLKNEQTEEFLVLNLYDEDSFELPKRNTCVFQRLVCCKGRLRMKRAPYCATFCVKTALLIMIAAIFTAVFVVFFDGLILIVVSVDPNGRCPDEGPYDCYDHSPDRTYYNCSSSDQNVDPSLGRVTCYRWFKQDITTHDVLDQIGLCGGLMAAFGVFVILFVRFNIYILKHRYVEKDKRDGEQKVNGSRRPTVNEPLSSVPQSVVYDAEKMPLLKYKDYCCCCNPSEFEFDDCCCFGLDKCCQQCIRDSSKGADDSPPQPCYRRCCTCLQRFERPELVIVWVIVLAVVISGLIIAMVLIGQYPVSVTGMTYAILATAFGVTAITFPIFLVQRKQSDLDEAKDQKNKSKPSCGCTNCNSKKEPEQSNVISSPLSSASNRIDIQGSNTKPTIIQNTNSIQPVRVLVAKNSDRYFRSPPQE
jgi:hypothetical protein